MPSQSRCNAGKFQAHACLLSHSAVSLFPCSPPLPTMSGLRLDPEPCALRVGVSITLRVAAQRSRLLLPLQTKRLCKLQAVPAWGIGRRFQVARCARSSRVCHRWISTPFSRPVFSLVASTCSEKNSVDAARGPGRGCAQGQLAGKRNHTLVCESKQLHIAAHTRPFHRSIERTARCPTLYAAQRSKPGAAFAKSSARCRSHGATASRVPGVYV